MKLFDKDTWEEIFNAIKKNKLRTAITVIGVLWGIFLFITLLGAARGMENGFNREFSKMATNSIFLWGQRTTMPYKGFQTGKPIQLKIQDAEAVQKLVPDVAFVAPRNVKGVFGGSPAHVKRKINTKTYKVFGDYPVLDKVSKVKLIDGRFLNLDDINQKRKVCIIGEKVIDELYKPDEQIVGSYVEINGSFFQVVGIYKDKQTGFEGADSIYIPFSTYRKIYNTGDEIGWMVIAAYDGVDIVKVEQEVKALLKRRHQVNPEDEMAFGAFNFGEMVGKLTGFISGMQFLTWFVGIATLIAGVIAIGSILLITVKERTNEIGIRRALGATPDDIKGQIVIESVFLTLLAGILGFIFSGVVLMIINALTKDNDDFPFVNPTVNIPIAIGAIIALVTFGTLIGLIPAQRAVNIRPIEALREE
ncbi:MAG: multidrug ABC transporter ATP-binding protein [Flavobacteriales bacterium]|nr:MAG: multidrug ABC transporter ATP-binding protein [Flavobacteriales bacterium]